MLPLLANPVIFDILGFMPIIKRAAKKLRHDKKRSIETASVRESLRALVKDMRKNPSAKALTAAFSGLDKAAKREIIHKNKADRLKARLSKLLSPKK